MSTADSNNNTDQSIAVGQTDFVLEDISVNSTAVRSNAVIKSSNGSQLKHSFYAHLRQNLWILPLLAAILLPLFSLSSYYYAVHHKRQITTIVPFISDAIGLAPQAGPANSLFDIVTILMTITGFIRYKQLKYYLVQIPLVGQNVVKPHSLNAEQIESLHQANFVSTISLYVGSFGMFIIANCRAPENQLLHLIGVMLFINGLSGYYMLMTYLTKKLNSVSGVESCPYTLVTATIISAVTMFLVTVLVSVSYVVAGPANFLNNQWRLHWSSEKPAYNLHLMSTIGEWISIVFCGIVFNLCLFRRFKNFTEWHKVQF